MNIEENHIQYLTRNYHTYTLLAHPVSHSFHSIQGLGKEWQKIAIYTLHHHELTKPLWWCEPYTRDKKRVTRDRCDTKQIDGTSFEIKDTY